MSLIYYWKNILQNDTHKYKNRVSRYQNSTILYSVNEMGHTIQKPVGIKYTVELTKRENNFLYIWCTHQMCVINIHCQLFHHLLQRLYQWSMVHTTERRKMSCQPLVQCTVYSLRITYHAGKDNEINELNDERWTMNETLDNFTHVCVSCCVIF